MKKVQIFGTGCARCRQQEENAVKAIKESGSDYELEKITAIEDIAGMNILMLPGIAIGGELISTGKILTAEEIKKFLL